MLPLTFGPRAHPLTPSAALYPRHEVSRILDRFGEESGATLTGVATSELLVVLGPHEELPWTPSVRYFGRDERAPRLLLSTAKTPSAPVDLLELAVCRGVQGAGPWLFEDESGTVIALSAARRFSRARLELWLAGPEAAEAAS